MQRFVHRLADRPSRLAPTSRGLLLAACVLASLAVAVAAAAQPQELTEEQERQLAEARALNSEAMRLLRAGQAGEAIPLATRATVIYEQVLGPAHPTTAEGFNNLGGMCQAIGELARAEKLHLRALAIRQESLGPEDLATASSMNNLAGVYTAMRDFAKAEPLHQRALAIYEKVHGKDHLETAGKLINLAFMYVSQGDYAQAEPLYARALTIREKSLGPKHPDTASTVDNLAYTLDMQGAYAKAEPLYARALAIREKVLGPDDLGTAVSLNNLGSLHYVRGDYAKAEPLFVRALAIREKSLGPEHPTTALSLTQLAALDEIQGEYAKAKAHCLRALAIREKTLGADHPDTANTMHVLAGIYHLLSDDGQAEPLYARALAIREKALGPDHPLTATTLKSMAVLYYDRGDYAQAEPLYVRAAETFEKSQGPNHPNLARYLNGLGLLYRAMGDTAKAEPLFVRAVAICEKTLGPYHADTAGCLNNLAGLYKLLGEYEKAEPLFLRAIEISEKALTPNHTTSAAYMNELGWLYCSMDDLDRAEKLFSRARAMTQRALGADHPDLAGSLRSTAYIYASKGDYAKAEPLYLRALEIQEKWLGPDHIATGRSLNNLAFLYGSMGDYEKAEPPARRAFEITLNNLDNTAFVQSQRQQLAMAGSDINKLDFYLSVAIPAKRYDDTAYALLLAWKGSVLTRQRVLRAAADDPRLAEKVAQLQDATTRLATLALQTPESDERDDWQRQINEQSQAKERLEQELARASGAFRATRARTTVEQMQAALPDDTALVDFIEYTLFQRGSDYPRRIAAFVLSKDQPVKLIDLALVDDVREAIDAWRTGGFGTSPDAQKAAALLREKIWQPLETHMAGAHTVLVSPDGDLGKLPLAALPGRKAGTYLIEEYALAVIPVPSALANPLSAPPDAHTAAGLLAVGDVDYDLQEASLDTLVVDTSPPGQRAVVGDQRLQFTPLKGTGPESIAVGKAFRAAFPDVRPIRLSGAQATEAAFRAAAPKHRYLHLATHGYFADASIRSALSRDVSDHAAMQAGLSSDQTLAGYHPDLLSGIALSGANQPATDGDDGILTAAEVQALDLRKVELVALSACETGLGQTAGGEGLLGLQRAFQAAGAQHVVASLWAVDDAATKTLMVEFYRNLWQEKLRKPEALRRAQLAMLERYDPRRHELRPRGLVLLSPSGEKLPPARLPPYYWAAFVLSGAEN